uniref:Uncharacterized protein n=1 Tax=Pipistrellus kuhlii TaxID=59472 RepID=A0A7J7YXN7_PIPKU|nr:hypothetical protein mPipKuh1_009815 [Pipistrellus kuhlii]
MPQGPFPGHVPLSIHVSGPHAHVAFPGELRRLRARAQPGGVSGLRSISDPALRRELAWKAELSSSRPEEAVRSELQEAVGALAVTQSSLTAESPRSFPTTRNLRAIARVCKRPGQRTSQELDPRQSHVTCDARRLSPISSTTASTWEILII